MIGIFDGDNQKFFQVTSKLSRNNKLCPQINIFLNCMKILYFCVYNVVLDTGMLNFFFSAG